MNWGYKIFFVIWAFIMIMFGMVYVSFQQENELIDDNYYEKEIKYQSIIDGARRLNSINRQAILNQGDELIILQLPKMTIQNFKNGQIEFLKSENQKKDYKSSFSPDSTGYYSINKSKLSKGAFTLRIAWYSDTTFYYREEKIVID